MMSGKPIMFSLVYTELGKHLPTRLVVAKLYQILPCIPFVIVGNVFRAKIEKNEIALGYVSHDGGQSTKIPVRVRLWGLYPGG